MLKWHSNEINPIGSDGTEDYEDIWRRPVALEAHLGVRLESFVCGFIEEAEFSFVLWRNKGS